MMNKKIFVPLVVVVVAVTAGVFGFEQMNSNYDPFSDPKYADNISTMTFENPWESYTGDKRVTTISALFEDLNFKQVVDKSTLIISGSIKDIQYVEKATNPEVPEDIMVSTIYTVTIHSYMKGSDNDHEIKFISMGGKTEKHITIFEDVFVFEKGDQLFLLLEEEGTIDDEILYTPITDIGSYKVTNAGPNSGEVHRFGESTTVPLPEFKSLIQSMID